MNANLKTAIARTLLALVALAGLATGASATDVYYYTPENITNIEGHYAVQIPWTNHVTRVVVSGPNGMGDAVLEPTDALLGDFTTVYPPAPRTQYQRSFKPSQKGATGCQMTGTQIGTMLHTWTIPEILGNYNAWRFDYRWDPNEVKPWTRSTSVLKFGCYQKIADDYLTGDARNFSYMTIWVVDPNGHYFTIRPFFYDSDGTPSTETLAYRPGVVPPTWVKTYFGTNLRYGNRDGSSSGSQGTPWTDWKYFQFNITRQNLLNAINAINEEYGDEMGYTYSTDVANYYLRLICIQNEFTHLGIYDGWSAMAIKDINLWEFYNE